MIERIIFDWKRTLYDPSTGSLLPGAGDVLQTLSERPLDLILIGKGGTDMDDALDTLGVRSYFSAVHFVPGKSNELFGQYISRESPQSTLVVGDRAQGEIAIGKRLGASAIWLRAGQFSDELPLPDLPPPDQIIRDISELLVAPLLDTIKTDADNS